MTSRTIRNSRPLIAVLALFAAGPALAHEPAAAEGDTAVPLKMRGPAPSVEVTINGQGPYRFLINLGASTPRLSAKTIDALGMDGEAASGKTFEVNSLTIGDETFDDVEFQAWDNEDDAGGTDAAGVLTLALFTDHLVTLDLAHSPRLSAKTIDALGMDGEAASGKTFEVNSLTIGDETFDDVEFQAWDNEDDAGGTDAAGVLTLALFTDHLVTLDLAHEEFRLERGSLPTADSTNILEYSLKQTSDPNDDDNKAVIIPVEIAGRPMGAVLRSIGAYVPSRRMSNHEFAEFVDTSDEWIRSHTGIGFRHVAADDQAASDLGVAAAKQALERAAISADEIDMVLCATASGDHVGFPSTACIIQDKLGASNAAAMDLVVDNAGGRGESDVVADSGQQDYVDRRGWA